MPGFVLQGHVCQALQGSLLLLLGVSGKDGSSLRSSQSSGDASRRTDEHR